MTKDRFFSLPEHPAVKKLAHLPFTLLLLAAMLLIFSLSSEKYMTFSNMVNVIVQCSTGIGIVALASYLAICSTGVDLSLGGVVSFSGMMAAKILVWDTSLLNGLREGQPVLLVLLAALAAMAVGAAVGALNGLILSKTNIPSFIVTLGTFKIAETMSRILAGGSTVRISNDLFAQIGGGSLYSMAIGKRLVGVLPYSMLILLALYLAASLLMKRTRFGTYIYAIGGNYDAAKLSGINVDGIRFKVFLINGVIAGIAGIVLASRLTAASASNGLGLEFDGIAAAVVGGASMTGGKSTPWRTLIGAFLICAMKNGFNLIDMPNSVQMITIGAVLIAIVAMDTVKARGKAV